MSKMMGAAAALVALLAVSMPSAEASHFRYGTMSWKALSDQPDPDKLDIQITVEIAFRRGWLADRSYPIEAVGNTFDLQGSTLSYGDGTQVDEFKDFVVTVTREADDLVMGQFRSTHTYDKFQGANFAEYTAVYQDCCRLQPCGEDLTTASGFVEGSDDCIHNNGDGAWNLEMLVYTNARGLKSATSSFLPVVEIGNVGVQVIELAGLPPDRDDLIWYLADSTAMMGDQPSADPDVYSINAVTGEVSWNVDGFPEGLYTTQLLVSGTKNPEVKVPIDFFIKITADVYLCVDQCSDSGIACAAGLSAGQPDACSGGCMGQSYAECQPNQLPQVVVPELVVKQVNEEVSFQVSFEESNTYEQYQTLQMQAGSLPPGATLEWFPSNVHSQYDYGVLTIPAELNTEPSQSIACFMADDGYNSGTVKCTKVDIIPEPPDCFNLYPTLEDCNTEPRCFWDKNGDNDSHPTRTRQGCYPFSACSQMDDTGLPCTSHEDCHYTGFGTCIESPDSVKPITQENPFGDPCRSFDKKTCREVDGRHLPRARVGKDRAHCVWDTLNRWCVTPELHISHADICRPINSVNECNNAVRNGDRCVWILDPYFRDMRSPLRDEHYGTLDNTICPHNKCPMNAPGICMSTQTVHGIVDGTDVGPATAALKPLGTDHKATYLNTYGAAGYTGRSGRSFDPKTDSIKLGRKRRSGDGKREQSGWKWVIPSKSEGLTESYTED